ncbi:DUF4365 domain-containing protein [Nocardia sp. NPDC088792]|uniref:DUF4365 domain-containing protein n=1 Tax=Nocardia sp. NPDC088792 TaxID=3364332 RepID=UPI00382EA879
MPPRRPDTHVNADITTTKLRGAFLSAGWTVQELNSSDYGEDLLVRIFDEGIATPYMFFVQAKHLEPGSKHRSKNDRYVSYSRFKRRHVEVWENFWQPVVLALWDIDQDQIYWDIAQSLDWPPTDRDTENCTIRFPTDNLLDADGLARIRARTINRAQRHEGELSGIKVLIDRVRELFDAEVDFDPGAERILITLPNGDGDLTFFGGMAKMITEVTEQTGLDGRTAYELLLILGTSFLKCADEHPVPFIRNGSVQLTTGAKGVMREALRDREVGGLDVPMGDGLAQFIENHSDLLGPLIQHLQGSDSE